MLRTPQEGWGHDQFIATTGEAGDVAVHTARARDGLLVTSVAAEPGVPAADVLAAAYRLATAIATGGPVAKRSLFTLPAGPAALCSGPVLDRRKHLALAYSSRRNGNGV